MGEQLSPQFDKLDTDSKIDLTELPDGSFVPTEFARLKYSLFSEEFRKANQGFGGRPWRFTKRFGLPIAAGLALIGGGVGLTHLFDGGIDTGHAQNMGSGQSDPGSPEVVAASAQMCEPDFYLLSITTMDAQGNRLFGLANLRGGMISQGNDPDNTTGSVDNCINGNWNLTLQLKTTLYPELASNPGYHYRGFIEGIANKLSTKTLFIGTGINKDTLPLNKYFIRGGEIILDYDDPDPTARIQVTSNGLPPEGDGFFMPASYTTNSLVRDMRHALDPNLRGYYSIPTDNLGVPLTGESWIKIDLSNGTPSPTATGTRTATPSPSATFTVEASKTPTSTATRTVTVTPTPAIVTGCVGDVDKNGAVTIIDFSLLRASFGLQSGDPGYNPDADFNGNGAIDIIDFSLLRASFGLAC